MSFEKLNLIEPILKALEAEGYTNPTPIQEQAIPEVLKRRDLLASAQTGTGKTAAFAIPVLQLLGEDHQPNFKGRRKIRCLILTPTRELAVQIGESFRSYGRNLPLRGTVIYGGVSQHSQVNALRNGIDILVATPGRLLDLMNQRHVNLADVEYFVLDEADRMLDMGFIHDVKKIITFLPEHRQTLFFSATMPPPIVELSRSILNDPVKVEVKPVTETKNLIKQLLFHVDRMNKTNLLLDILSDGTIDRALVFTRTKHGADKVAKTLTRAGVESDAIHGNKSQNARQAALNKFKQGKLRVLVATDIAARGIDIDDLAYVVNYDLPEVPETYVHRIGRTGRAGASGVAVSFCDQDERYNLRDIQRFLNQQITVVEGHPFAMETPRAETRPTPPPARKQQGQRHSRPAREKVASGGGETGYGNGPGPKKPRSNSKPFWAKRKSR